MVRRTAYSPRTYAAARAFDHEGQPVEVPAFALMAWHGTLQMPEVRGDESDNDEEAPGARFNEPTSVENDDSDED